VIPFAVMHVVLSKFVECVADDICMLIVRVTGADPDNCFGRGTLDLRDAEGIQGDRSGEKVYPRLFPPSPAD